MARHKRTTEQELYDIFTDADYADQDAMLRVFNELHRQARRGRLGKGAANGAPQPEADEPEQVPLLQVKE
jgi:hypothetical protein